MISANIEPILAEDAKAYAKRLMGWPYAGVAPQADVWARRKYLLYREVWTKRHDACPGFKDERGKPITWATRFERMTLEPIADYHQRLRAAQSQAAA